MRVSTVPKAQWKHVVALYVSGLPMRVVAEQLNVSINAVTYILRKLRIPRRSFKEANRLVFESKPLSFSVTSPRSSEDKLLEAMGVMLYWAEGYKSSKALGIDFANSSPDMVFLFLKFLRRRYCFDEKRLKVLLYCYSNQDVPSIITFWSKLLNIPKTQFTKPYIRSDYREDARTMEHGLVHLRYSDKKLLLHLLNLIESYTHRYCVGGGVVNRTTL